MRNSWRTVTIVIPCLNEEERIEACLESLLANDYPRELSEIWVMDGHSSDRTREIVAGVAERDERVKLVGNPDRGKSEALNMAILRSRADVILRADAHAVYDTHYVKTLIEGLNETGAENLGGVRETYPGETIKEQAIAWVISSPLGAGNSPWRTGADAVQEVETVFGGCYPRSVFEEVGLFEPALKRAQDREFNARLRRSGGRILLDPRARCTYFPRTRLSDYVRWTWDGAYSLFGASRFTTTPLLAWRNLLPAGFVGYQVLLLVTTPALRKRSIPLYAPIVAYWGVVTTASLIRSRHANSSSFVPWGIAVLACTHYVYGAGSLAGAVVSGVSRLGRWKRGAQ